MTHKTVEEDDVFTLLILEASSMDRGVYECFAKNTIGEVKCQATVDVVPTGGSRQGSTSGASGGGGGVTPLSPGQIKRPEVLDHLKNSTVQEGKEIVFKTRFANINGMCLPVYHLQ